MTECVDRHYALILEQYYLRLECLLISKFYKIFAFRLRQFDISFSIRIGTKHRNLSRLGRLNVEYLFENPVEFMYSPPPFHLTIGT